MATDVSMAPAWQWCGCLCDAGDILVHFTKSASSTNLQNLLSDVSWALIFLSIYDRVLPQEFWPIGFQPQLRSLELQLSLNCLSNFQVFYRCGMVGKMRTSLCCTLLTIQYSKELRSKMYLILKDIWDLHSSFHMRFNTQLLHKSAVFTQRSRIKVKAKKLKKAK